MKLFKVSKRFKSTFNSLPEEILIQIFFNISQYDAINIRLLNKKLNKLASVRLFNSLYVYLNKTKVISPFPRKAKIRYWPLMVEYTVVDSYDSFNTLVRNVVFSVHSSRQYSDYCYSYLTKNCPWITIDVQSYRKDMIEHQLSRIDSISQLRVRNRFYFNPANIYNVSIKRFYIVGSRSIAWEPLDLIPKLKSLTALCIRDSKETDIIDHLMEKNISGLKLKQLALRVPQLSIREMDLVFDLNEIESLELIFYNTVDAYDDLKWLCTKMPKLGNISVGWSNVSFERVMNSLLGHKFYEISLKRYGREQAYNQSEVLQLVQGHASVIRFGIYAGIEFIEQMWEPVMFHNIHKQTHAAKFLKYFTKNKFPNLVMFRMNFMYFIV
ncbi:hypothetical protein JA1_001062 [Spathaspora sp. JA1]|nr:hypothetical protein JA1_001062 [Spathaspora sp. JA1]